MVSQMLVDGEFSFLTNEDITDEETKIIWYDNFKYSWEITQEQNSILNRITKKNCYSCQFVT